MDEKQLKELEGYITHNNITIIEATKESCKVKVDIKDISLNPYKIVHGGLIFSMGDTVMGTMCRIMGKKGVTLNANIDYLKPGTGKYLIAEAEVVKMGKTTAVLKANIYNDKNELISIMGSTYYFIA